MGLGIKRKATAIAVSMILLAPFVAQADEEEDARLQALEDRMRSLEDRIISSEATVEAQREVLRLRYVEDLTRGEIAEVLEVPESAVKSRLFETLKRLREKASLLDQS